jgi:hypothetical protein
MSKRNPKIDRRTLMKNEVPVKKADLERLRAKEKVLDEKKVLMYQVKISKLPIGEDDRKYYAVDPENLIVQQKAQLLKQDGLMKDMRTEFNTQRTKLEKKIITMQDVYKADVENLRQKMKKERVRSLVVSTILFIIIVIMMFI